MENRKPYFSNDAEHDPVVDQHARESLKFYNLIDVPIIDRQGRVMGCFNVHNSVDHRPFDEQDIAILEILASNASLALENMQALEDKRRSYQSEQVLNALLQLSIQGLAFSDLLEQSLDRILETPWLPDTRMGVIFLAEEGGDALIMKAQRNLPATLQSTCARVPFGCCICGVAAASRESLFADHGDERHDYCRNALNGHAHYAIPLMKDSTVLGLFMLYLDKGHQRDEREMAYLNTVGNVLAGVVLHKQESERSNTRLNNYARLVESTSAIAWRMDIVSGEFLYIAPQIESLLGYPVDSWKDVDCWAARIHPEDRERATSYCSKKTAQGRHHDFTYRAIAADGRVVWIRDNVSIVREDEVPVELVGFFFDITEGKRAAEVFKAAERRFSGVLEMVPAAIITFDDQQKIIAYNRGAETIFAYHQEEALGLSLEMLLPKRFRAVHADHFANFVNSPTSSMFMASSQDVFGLRKNGEEFPAEASITKTNMDGRTIFTLILHDITERKQAEAERQKLSHIIEQGDDGILITNTKAVIEYVNPAFCGITGYTQEEIIGKTPAILKSTAQDPDYYKDMWKSITSGRVWHGTLVDRHKDGSFYP
ncbi:MAG: PAS domain S-box protein, partial [Mariprofundaceae bacterium]|nr:PAS domain S-box protein [Mariprofundaceae bacterium]